MALSQNGSGVAVRADHGGPSLAPLD